MITPEDLLPVLALALLAGQRGAHAGRLALYVLPLSWLCGGLAGLALPTIGETPVLASVSFLLLGGLVAAEAPLPPAAVTGVAVVVGLLHGYPNGSAMFQARLGALGLVGIAVTLFVTVALAAAMVVAIRVPWGRIAVRVAGSWIVAIGLLLLGWSLRGSCGTRNLPGETRAHAYRSFLHEWGVFEAALRPDAPLILGSQSRFPAGRALSPANAERARGRAMPPRAFPHATNGTTGRRGSPLRDR